MGLVLAGAVLGCGDDEADQGPPVVTAEVLGDALALAAREDLEQRGVFGTSIGEKGGVCRGGTVRWSCTLDVVINDSIRDRRVYAMRVRQNGCWTARQTGTDVGATGEPSRPERPSVLRGCVE
jgi:hypothetical protein